MLDNDNVAEWEDSLLHPMEGGAAPKEKKGAPKNSEAEREKRAKKRQILSKLVKKAKLVKDIQKQDKEHSLHIGHLSHKHHKFISQFFTLEHYPLFVLMALIANVLFMTLVYPKYVPAPKATKAATKAAATKATKAAKAVSALELSSIQLAETPVNANSKLQRWQYVQSILAVLILFAMVHDGSSRLICGDGTFRKDDQSFDNGKFKLLSKKQARHVKDLKDRKTQKRRAVQGGGGGGLFHYKGNADLKGTEYEHGKSVSFGRHLSARGKHFKITSFAVLLFIIATCVTIAKQFHDKDPGLTAAQRCTSWINLVFSFFFLIILIMGKHEELPDAKKAVARANYGGEIVEMVESDPFGLLGRNPNGRVLNKVGWPIFVVIRHVEESGAFRWILLAFLLLWNIFLLSKVTLMKEDGEKVENADQGKAQNLMYKLLRYAELLMICILVFTASGGDGRIKGGGDTCASMGKRGSMGMSHGKRSMKGWLTKGPLAIILILAVVGLLQSGYTSFVMDIFLVMFIGMGMNQAGSECPACPP